MLSLKAPWGCEAIKLKQFLCCHGLLKRSHLSNLFPVNGNLKFIRKGKKKKKGTSVKCILNVKTKTLSQPLNLFSNIWFLFSIEVLYQPQDTPDRKN